VELSEARHLGDMTPARPKLVTFGIVAHAPVAVKIGINRSI
jgi:hypothetical protein